MLVRSLKAILPRLLLLSIRSQLVENQTTEHRLNLRILNNVNLLINLLIVIVVLALTHSIQVLRISFFCGVLEHWLLKHI